MPRLQISPARPVRTAITLVAVLLVAGCAGEGGTTGAMMPAGNGASVSAPNGTGNTVVKIFVPGSSQAIGAMPKPPLISTPAPQIFSGAAPITTPPPAATTSGTQSGGSAGGQVLAINVSGPATITQTVAVGPNASGCSPAPGGTNCQLTLNLPVGTYTGTIGNSTIAFTVAAVSNNALNLALNAVPSQLQIVPASAMSAQTAQGSVDLYGAGKHALLVEALDANNNVIVGNAASSFSMSQAGGSLPLSVTQSAMSPNLFYVSAPSSSSSSAILRANANYQGPSNPCAQAGSACRGTVRVNLRQILGVANSNINTVALYVNGQTTPLATIQGITNPQALIFDGLGNLFVASQPGSVNVYAPPYNQAPTTIASGVNRPQALALDARGNLFVANGSGSNTVTLYSPPYAGRPSQIISANVDDPVSLALDSNADLFVLNAAANTVTEYAPPYTGAPTTISKGLFAPNSLALDSHGNLFVANLNSTPNSVVEYAPPFSNQSAPVATISNGVNEQGTIGLSPSANLFVPNQGANTVTEYVAPYTGQPTTIVGGQSQPIALAIDSLGNLYVANYGNNTVTEYQPPYVAGSWTTYATGISAPLSLALSPATNSGPTLLP
jgi:hypothetical protein